MLVASGHSWKRLRGAGNTRGEVFVALENGGDVAQLVEHRTGTLPTQVRFRCGKGFFCLSQLSVQTLLRCPYTPVCNRMHLHLGVR